MTVGLPVFNGEPYLVAAIDSILAQTHEDLRLVISDNGSTDATEEICRSYVSRDERVTYERQAENRGAAWNYNRTVALADGPYFKWAAADDLLAPACIERCLEAFRSGPPSLVMVYPRTMLVDDAGAELGVWDDKLDVRAASPSVRFNTVVRNVVLGNPIFGLMRSSALARTRLHGSFPSADWVLLAELALLGEIHEVPEPLFLRRMHEGTSRAANRTAEELTAWFDPHIPTVRHEKRRLLREYVVSILRSDLSVADRARTLLRFALTWSRRHGRAYASLAALRHRVGR